MGLAPVFARFMLRTSLGQATKTQTAIGLFSPTTFDSGATLGTRTPDLRFTKAAL